MSRLLLLPLLYQAGYAVGKYVSFEKAIEKIGAGRGTKHVAPRKGDRAGSASAMRASTGRNSFASHSETPSAIRELLRNNQADNNPRSSRTTRLPSARLAKHPAARMSAYAHGPRPDSPRWRYTLEF